MKQFYIILLILSMELFAQNVATVTALKGSATIQRLDDNIQAKIGTKVENKDHILTKSKAKMQIIFKDDTIITIGRNSSFSIEEYLFDDSQKSVAKFNIVAGAMRVITGQIGKVAPHKFKVKTKSATLGIRGTNFTIIVLKDGSFISYCTYGAISVSFNSKEHIIQQGYYINISPTFEIKIKSFDAIRLKDINKKYFATNNKKDSSNVKKKYQSYKESNEGLDVKFRVHFDILQNLIDSTSDYITEDSYSITDKSIIAEYSMQEAQYRGIYTTSSSTGTLNSSGDAAMTIDFGADTAWLGLGNFIDPKEQASYNFTNVNTNHITGTQTGSNGSATGDFYTKTGNSINGSFIFMETTSDDAERVTAKGTYDVSSFQKLQ